MGKANRNRQFRQMDRAENPEKYKAKKKKVSKPMPKWVTPLICIVLLVAIMCGIAQNIISKYGLIQHSRVIVESKTGKYDVTQKIATYVAWKNIYYSDTNQNKTQKAGVARLILDKVDVRDIILPEIK